MWFKTFLYVFLVIKSIYWLCYYDVLFGENSIMYSQPRPLGMFKDFAFLLYNSASVNTGYAFIGGVFVLVAFNLFVKKNILFLSNFLDFLIWFLVLNIHNKIYLTLTAGDYLLNQFLFFNFLLTASFRFDIKSSSLLLHNVGVIGITAQICFAYFMAGLAKIVDPLWMKGEAVASIVQIYHYNVYSVFTYNKKMDLLYLAANYLVIFYQFLFPVFVWFHKIKKPFLILGILMNLYIAFVMGLFSFGVVMILGYTFFWPFTKEEQ